VRLDKHQNSKISAIETIQHSGGSALFCITWVAFCKIYGVVLLGCIAAPKYKETPYLQPQARLLKKSDNLITFSVMLLLSSLSDRNFSLLSKVFLQCVLMLKLAYDS